MLQKKKTKTTICLYTADYIIESENFSTAESKLRVTMCWNGFNKFYINIKKKKKKDSQKASKYLLYA